MIFNNLNTGLFVLFNEISMKIIFNFSETFVYMMILNYFYSLFRIFIVNIFEF